MSEALRQDMLYTPYIILKLLANLRQWFNDTSDADNDAYLYYIFDKYKVVGDQSMETQILALKQNKHEYCAGNLRR